MSSQPSLFGDSGRKVERFDGETFDVKRDSARLTRQLDRVRVWVLQQEGRWFTLEQMRCALGYQPTSVPSLSARLRNLRQAKHGGFTVEHEFVNAGLWKYRVDPRSISCAPTLPTTMQERFWPKVEKTSTCWLWLAKKDKDGYGIVRGEEGKMVKAHRWSYEQAKGPIGEGLQIDHLCRVRHCVNPSHLEVVTPKINSERGISPAALMAHRTHCNHGHPFSGENLRERADGGKRRCRLCSREYTRQYRERKLAGKTAVRT